MQKHSHQTFSIQQNKVTICDRLVIPISYSLIFYLNNISEF